jgi:hypothetical protein
MLLLRVFREGFLGDNAGVFLKEESATRPSAMFSLLVSVAMVEDSGVAVAQ